MPLMDVNPVSEAPVDNAAPEEAATFPVEAKKTRPKRKVGVGGASGSAGTAAKISRRTESKADAVLKKLRSTKGVTVATLMQATGWQVHSVRGFLSGTVKKKLRLTLTSEVGKDRVRRYRITDRAK